MIEDTVVDRLAVVALGENDYRDVIDDAAALGLLEWRDLRPLHAHCARKERADQILTYNLADFARFEFDGIRVSAP